MHVGSSLCRTCKHRVYRAVIQHPKCADSMSAGRQMHMHVWSRTHHGHACSWSPPTSYTCSIHACTCICTHTCTYTAPSPAPTAVPVSTGTGPAQIVHSIVAEQMHDMQAKFVLFLSFQALGWCGRSLSEFESVYCHASLAPAIYATPGLGSNTPDPRQQTHLALVVPTRDYPAGPALLWPRNVCQTGLGALSNQRGEERRSTQWIN